MTAYYIGDCSRCGTRQVTFDVRSNVLVGIRHGWAEVVEFFAVCRACRLSSIFQAEKSNSGTRLNFKDADVLATSNISFNDILYETRLITARDRFVDLPPEHLPEKIEKIVSEANACFSAECWNAAGSMYRLVLDWVTKGLLPSADQEGLNSKTRRSLGLRTIWLFENGLLPQDLLRLADCIREDGNDGAHDGSLTRDDAEDIKDFCYELLRRIYTEPTRILAAEARRISRRDAKISEAPR